MARTGIVWDESLTGYDFGAGHPMDPLRLDLTARLCREFGLLDHEGVCLVAPDVPPDELLLSVHTPQYVEAVKQASAHPTTARGAFGLGTEDDPAFLGIHEVSARIAAGTVAMARGVWEGEYRHGVNFAGGLHHAMPDSASGFCVYNDAGAAIRWLLDHGAERVAYVDVDAHHGDGVERMFWDDPRVLTVSVHETGAVLFPGTGFAADTGGPGAPTGAVNLALPPGVGDLPWLRAFHAVVPAVLRAFGPQILISQHGTDSHARDPLAHLSLSVDAQRVAIESLRDLAVELCGGRWVAVGGGGYEIVGVVPRTWTYLVAAAQYRPLPVTEPVPREWADYVRGRTGQEAPRFMGDGASEDGRLWWSSWETGFDPENSVDRAVMATREAVFPGMGLDIWYD
ncbi:acetoin utilization protein AcuC [Austwickia chelonae]|uniref:Acetoin utilization protein AcuC n=1 Tax=Austwickia chelonae NBRC 105200 TaxID=1184607 RepID=K6W501_9MICO|nr:acetoin utilization protein AcuC [Austwickia chelonae]GAB76907.1 putative deacetylase [Austwickia chelonae NBRC 105200]SEW32218.1 acetoin utilization protein AcuC [Austwickia chelonae]